MSYLSSVGVSPSIISYGGCQKITSINKNKFSVEKHGYTQCVSGLVVFYEGSCSSHYKSDGRLGKMGYGIRGHREFKEVLYPFYVIFGSRFSGGSGRVKRYTESKKSYISEKVFLLFWRQN